MARITVHVVPRSKTAGPDGYHGDVPRLRVRSAPADNKANAEAERLLRELLGSQVSLVGGARSRRKTFEVALEQTELERAVRDVFTRARGRS